MSVGKRTLGFWVVLGVLVRLVSKRRAGAPAEEPTVAARPARVEDDETELVPIGLGLE